NAPTPISNVMPFRIAFETALPKAACKTRLYQRPHPDPPPRAGEGNVPPFPLAREGYLENRLDQVGDHVDDHMGRITADVDRELARIGARSQKHGECIR